MMSTTRSTAPAQRRPVSTSQQPTRRRLRRFVAALVPLFALAIATPVASAQAPAPATGPAGAAADFAWPPATRTSRPGAFWWWMGSAVNPGDLTREMERYRAAGLGTVHIIPIYGAKGYEDRSIEYLSPRWMEMLRHVTSEGKRLDMDVDMTLGTGWCFGGPDITPELANASVQVKTFDAAAGERVAGKFDPKDVQALVAFGPGGDAEDLTRKIGPDGSVTLPEGGGPWRVYAVSQRFSGQKVKRASPGGEGPMLNPFYAEAMRTFTARFTKAFDGYDGPRPRAVYQDSYEYRCDWSPDLLAEFERRRGYRLQPHLPALLDKDAGQGGDGAARDRAARVKGDYRETVSDLMVQNAAPVWVNWARERGFLTRYQAHGAPGNLLDLYAAADVAETEMFHKDRDPLVAKVASSAAHVAGHPLVSSETGTWLAEHFTVTLGQMKGLVDELFASGVNHVFYHGACYSPDEAGWPGWVFYASTQMNPRNSIWRDAPALNAYIARCQSVLQSGRPDNDVLVYWPIHDFWHDPDGLVRNLTIHARDWFGGQPAGEVAKQMWERGYTFDYASDRQLAAARAADGAVRVPGGAYRVVLVPRCEHIPVPTMERLLALAEGGATVVFQDGLPRDVPGLGDLEGRRAALRKLLERVKPEGEAGAGVRRAAVGKGAVLAGAWEPALAAAKVAREPVADHPGVLFIRRAHDAGRHYFIANHGDRPIDGWTDLGTNVASAVVMDPMTGRAGAAAVRPNAGAAARVYLQLRPGESVILRTFADRRVEGTPWPYAKAAGGPSEVKGTWRVKFVAGGPELPKAFETDKLGSWTARGDPEAERFAGTAVYAVTFDAPRRPDGATGGAAGGRWLLDLGAVGHSARVRLNGKDLGAALTAPFQLPVDDLKPGGNLLEVEVTSVAANRIRDLDKRGVKWKNFHDINFVNIDYKPFDASGWPVRDCGLMGPVTLTVVEDLRP